MKPFIERAKDVEILYRGKILSESAVTEWALLRIIIFSTLNLEQQKIEALNFKNLLFYQKINKAEEILRDIHPQIFESIKDEFAELHRLRKFRNLIAHSMFSWDKEEKDITFFYVWDIETDEDKIQYQRQVKYTLIEALDMVTEIRKINMALLRANIDIEDDFNKKYPGLLNLDISND